ncbi:MAG: hypothetical protein ACI8Y7_000048 [Candidatus Woesearchaeota archaeon]|jgi:hypothetical protein
MAHTVFLSPQLVYINFLRINQLQFYMYNKVITFVNDAFKGKNIKHFDRTVHWIKVLKPDADDALIIAAYSHDIERALRKPETPQVSKKKKDEFRDEEFLTFHQEEGARIIGEFLKKEGVDNNFITRVKHLVSKHEVGGDDDQNLLKDCDSISFFETNAAYFVSEKAPVMGEKVIQDKFDWMFDRITLEEAKTIAKPMYTDALRKLEEL